MSTIMITHDCDQYAKLIGRPHVHCTVQVSEGDFGSPLVPCGAILLASSDGTVQPDSGAACAKCFKPTCPGHLRTNTPSGRVLCLDCEMDESAAAQHEAAMDFEVVDAKGSLGRILERIEKEPDAKKLRELVGDVHQLDDLLAQISRALFTRLKSDHAGAVRGAA